MACNQCAMLLPSKLSDIPWNHLWRRVTRFESAAASNCRVCPAVFAALINWAVSSV